jgi:hypothetical protein
MKRFGRFLELLNRTAGAGAVADQLSASEWAELRDEAQVAAAEMSRDPMDWMPGAGDPRASSEASPEDHAMFLYDGIRVALHALRVSADDTKARNYVEFAFVGLSLPFDRAAITLIRPGGKAPHECVAEQIALNEKLKERILELEKLEKAVAEEDNTFIAELAARLRVDEHH